MPVYFVAQIRIDDREKYGEYEAGFLDVFQKYDGELVAVDDAPERVEGEWPFTRMVLLRFPDREAAETWYRSDEYQALAKKRLAASEGTLTLVNAFS